MASVLRESGLAGSAGVSIDDGIAAVVDEVMVELGTAAVGECQHTKVWIKCTQWHHHLPDEVVPARSHGFGGLAIVAAPGSV